MNKVEATQLSILTLIFWFTFSKKLAISEKLYPLYQTKVKSRVHAYFLLLFCFLFIFNTRLFAFSMCLKHIWSNDGWNGMGFYWSLWSLSATCVVTKYTVILHAQIKAAYISISVRKRGFFFFFFFFLLYRHYSSAFMVWFKIQNGSGVARGRQEGARIPGTTIGWLWNDLWKKLHQ